MKREKVRRRIRRIKINFRNLIFIFIFVYVIFWPIGISIFIINRLCGLKHSHHASKYKKYKISSDTQIHPTLNEDNDYVFKTNRELKILQLTDLHIGGGFLSYRKDRLAIKAIARMVIEEKPDLIVVTGDIAYPVFFQAGSFGNIHQQKIMAKIFNSLEVYWTFVYGNHDTEVYSPYSKDNVTFWYKLQIKNKEEYKYCIFTDKDYDSASGYGNQFIKVENEKNQAIQNIVLFDSHAYAKGNFLGLKQEYDHVKYDQVEWAINKINKVAEENNKMIKTIVFLHIPLVEYRDAYKEYRLYGESDLVKLKSGAINKNEEKRNKFDDKTWGINASSTRSSVFDGLTQINTLQAVFCGHDHKNDLNIYYKGVLLGYSKPIDYLAYPKLIKNKKYRGCNIVFINQDSSFTSQVHDFYEDKYQKLEIVLKDKETKYDKENL